MIRIFGVLLVLSGLLFASCKDKPANDIIDNNLDREAMLTNYADHYIIPGYTAMEVSSRDLRQAFTHFSLTPSSINLLALQAAADSTYVKWQTISFLEVGPAEEISLKQFTNSYPVSISKVNANISSGGADLDAFGMIDAQGFPAIDYLLYGVAATNAGIVDYYTDATEGAKRLQYLNLLIEKLYVRFQKVNQTWSSYKSSFIASAGVDAGSSFSKITNAYIQDFEKYFRTGKLGLPLGTMTGQIDLNLIESKYHPELTLRLFRANLNTLQVFFQGNMYNGEQRTGGFSNYLGTITSNTSNSNLAMDINSGFSAIIESTSHLQGTLKDNLVSNKPQLLSLYDQIQNLVPLLKVDMVSSFSISITYTDNDGD